MIVSDFNDVKKSINRLPNSSPVLLIGDAVNDFRRAWKYPIKRVTNTEEVRELIAQYQGVNSLQYPLVIEDLGFLNESQNFMLLKLVEEAKFPIILLARYDKISAIMLSRIKTVVKYQKEEIKSEFLSPVAGSAKIEEQLSADSHYYDVVRYQMMYSPKLYMYTTQLKKTRGRDKIISLLD